MTSADSRERAVATALDVFANIAGRGSLGAAEEFSQEQLRDQMEVNFVLVSK